MAGADEPARPGPGKSTVRQLRLVVATTVLLGVFLALASGAGFDQPLLHTGTPVGAGVAVLVVLAALSEVAYVRVPHGDSTEDLTFFEVVIVTAAIVLPPAHVLAGALAGLAAACLLLRRPLVKTLFNIGTYATGTAVFLIVSHLVSGPSSHAELDARVVLGLVLGAAAFGGVNLLALAAVLLVVEGREPLSWLHQEWATSALMVGGSVGVGAVTVELALSNPVLLPSVGLPVLALMHSYRASQHHAQARKRADALVALNSVFAARQPPDELVGALAGPLGKLFDADAHVLLPGESAPAEPGAVVVPLDLGDDRGHLVLRPARTAERPFRGGWRLDEPMLVAVASAVASVLRAARHLDALVEESSKMQAVVDHATDGIAVVDTDGQVLVWSPSMRELVGEPPAHVPTDTPGGVVVALLSALSTDPEPTTRTLARSLAPNQVRAKTSVTIVGRGDERDVDVSIARIRSGAGSGLAVLTLRDTTQERRLEKMKADFVATVSHELKTPITPIKGYARLLSSRGDRMEPARRLHALQLIEDRADHLSRLVDDLLLASRVVPSGPGKLKVDLDDVDLRNVVRQAVSAFPLLSVRLDVQLPAQPVLVRCDLVRAVQCLANLVNNAEKYSPEDTRIGVKLLASDSDSFARVVVSDQGRGIAPGELDRIFERFHRVEDPFTMQTSGSGLGLYIARELARAMGGDISVQSTLGAGSTFTLRLPRVTTGGSQAATDRVPSMVA